MLKKEAAIQQTFEAVNEQFGQVFAELVPGGKANLIMLKQGDENDESNNKDKSFGVGIQTSFSGVQQPEDERNISQLSGGQQSVVSLGLIFAIQRCDPAPFYIFHEIDAALD